MESNNTTIIYIRHGQTFANKRQNWSGVNEVKLTNKGKKDSEKICKKLNQYNIDAIYCSPLKRAKYLAKKISNERKIKIIFDERIIERNFGSLEGRPVSNDDKNKIGDWNLNTDLSCDVEKIQEMYFSRVKPFIQEIIKKHKGKSVVIVSHSWIGRLLSFYSSKEKDFEVINSAPKNSTPIVFKF